MSKLEKAWLGRRRWLLSICAICWSGRTALAAPKTSRALFSAPSASQALTRAVSALRKDHVEEDWLLIEIQRNSENRGWSITFSKDIGNTQAEWIAIVEDMGKVTILFPR